MTIAMMMLMMIVGQTLEVGSRSLHRTLRRRFWEKQKAGAVYHKAPLHQKHYKKKHITIRTNTNSPESLRITTARHPNHHTFLHDKSTHTSAYQCL